MLKKPPNEPLNAPRTVSGGPGGGSGINKNQPDSSRKVTPIQLAYTFARMGFLIFPCNPDKTPMVKWLESATTDRAVIASWWTRRERALIGIPAKLNGFFVLDVDRKNGVDGQTSLVNLANGRDLQVGPCQKTPSGGWHLIYKYPDFEVKNCAGLLGDGLDLRSAGYICSGAGYEWIPGHELTKEIPSAPEWLLAEIHKLSGDFVTKSRENNPPQPSGDVVTFWLKYYLDRAKPGCRNEMAYKMGLQLSYGGVDLAMAEEAAKAFTSCVPQSMVDPFTELEAIRAVRSAYLAPRREPNTPRG